MFFITSIHIIQILINRGPLNYMDKIKNEKIRTWEKNIWIRIRKSDVILTKLKIYITKLKGRTKMKSVIVCVDLNEVAFLFGIFFS